MYRIYLVSCLVLVRGGPAKIDKDQFCTDPRTMAQHPAYTEWADAYSCTRHRCQPGGRNLAIYTVGCKRVEAPESAIECEEVVEDTNMQFPYCCTRLRCLVVVRGEVWTRVLGQPWETLPAAPWSHMYKMKKPPPVDSFHKKGVPTGPVYELTDPTDKQTQDSGPVIRATKDEENCEKPVARASATPDIVIALTTKDKKTNTEESRPSFRAREKQFKYDRPVDRESVQHNEIEPEDERYNEKDISDEQAYSVPDNSRHKTRNEVSEEHYLSEAEQNVGKVQKDSIFPEVSEEKEKPRSNTGSLQTLVDAIGTRMRDIENVVQRMNEQVAPLQDDLERSRLEGRDGKILETDVDGKDTKTMQDDYDRISPHQTRYLRTEDHTTEKPIFVDDPNLHGYFSDPSNNMRRANRPKERPDMFQTWELFIGDSYPCGCVTNPLVSNRLAYERRALGAEVYEPPLETYMVPIDTNHRTDAPEFDEKAKHKKHTHKKKKSKHGKKKHRRDDRENFNNIPTSDIDKNGLSLENSSFGTS